jgi:hypothetical protein
MCSEVALEMNKVKTLPSRLCKLVMDSEPNRTDEQEQDKSKQPEEISNVLEQAQISTFFLGLWN